MHGTISESLRSMFSSLLAPSPFWVFIRVGSTLPCYHRMSNLDPLKVLTYIEVGAIAVGISPGFAFYLLSITNASSGVGRVICGVLGDKLGALNVSAPLTLVCAIMTYAWPFATTKGPLIVIAIIYGFCCGAYITLLPAPLMAMGDIHDAGGRTGLAMTGIAVGAVVGPPISGALIRTAGGYHTVSYYAGTVPTETAHP